MKTICLANILSSFVVLGLSGGLSCPDAYSATTPTFGSNAIVNGNAEDGVGSASGDVVVIPDWATAGDFTAVQYGAAGFPDVASPGPSNRGQNFFAGGPSNLFSSASQSIDLSSMSTVVDGGDVSFVLSGYFGGWESQDDNAIFTARFQDGTGSELGAAAIGGVLSSDRGSVTGLLFRDASGNVPTGTRQIELVLDMERRAGFYNDGYADDLSLVLTAVPEPTSAALLVSVLGLLVVIGRRNYAISLTRQ